MPQSASYRTRHDGNDTLPTHRHRTAYAAMVIEGHHLECGADGSFQCTPGTLILHPGFHAHGNRFGRRGAQVLNIALPAIDVLGPLRVLRVPSLREAVAVMTRAPWRLDELLAEAIVEAALVPPVWQAALARALAITESDIGAICRDLGVSPAHASRATQRHYGMSPQALRRELRWRAALPGLAGDEPLADIAMRCGFADQSHFNRVTRDIAGLPPAALRRWIKSVQDGAAERRLK